MMYHQYEPTITKEDIDAVSSYMNSGSWITEHKVTQKLQEEIQAYLGVAHAHCVVNGTIAISIALLACGVKRGDEVLVPDLTMVATATACELIGAKPIFIDVAHDSLCMDAAKARKAVYKLRPKALIYVSLNGRWDTTGEMLRLFNDCRNYNIPVIEDAAQSFGSRNVHGLIGKHAKVTTFSMSPHKAITSGQGGFIVTDDLLVGERVKRLKDFGRLEGGTDLHDTFGINAKFTDLQASLALSQLQRIDSIVDRKKEIYATYFKYLKDEPNLRFIGTYIGSSPWFVDIYTGLRDELAVMLRENNIFTRPIYPTLSNQPMYNRNSMNLVAEEYSRLGLWLPSSLSLQDKDIRFICDKIKEFFDNFQKGIFGNK